MGYGANSVVHHAGLFRLSQDLPIIVEIVDDDPKIRVSCPLWKPCCLAAASSPSKS